MANIKELRSKRRAEEIPSIILVKKSGIERCRLSLIECWHLQPTEDELKRISVALNGLIAARRNLQQVAEIAMFPCKGGDF